MIPQVFRDVDILASLAGIMDQHTKYYKDDFDLDKSIIHTLSRSSDENDRRLIWLCRPLGTLKSYGIEIFDNRTVYSECTFHLVPKKREPSVPIMCEWVNLPTA